MNKIIIVKNLTKKFKEFTAVDDISFDVEKGYVRISFMVPAAWRASSSGTFIVCLITPLFKKFL